METIVVTGGAGFIGSNFVRLALRELPDARIVVFDLLTYAGNLASLADVADDPRYAFVRGDVADRDDVRRLFAEVRPDAVVNFAAESHVDRSIDDPGAFLRTNVQGTFELLEAARRHRRELPAERRDAFRFLHVSTDEVYGSLGPEGAFREDTAYAPRSPYSASKAGADHLVLAWHETFGLPTLLTNCSNNYGPYQFPEKLIPLMILNAVEGRDLPIYGDGGNVRDWIYVEDHCRGVLEVLRRGAPGARYNLGGNAERTNLEVVDTLCDALEAELPAAENPALVRRGAAGYRDLKSFVPDRPGHDRRYAIDDGLVRRELGWRPRHDFTAGVAATVRWYLAHRDWCEEVQSGTYRRERLGLGGVRFARTPLPGVLVVEPTVHRDPRGFFLETYHREKYAAGGLDAVFVQDNHSRSTAGTLRGLHAQLRRPQGKLVRAVRGSVFDVAVDIRRGSPTFGRWVGETLSADNFRQLWIPPGFAHGFCVLTEAAEVEYKCTALYDPADEITIAWDDEEIGIEWPVARPVLSERDRAASRLAEVADRLPVHPRTGTGG